MGIVSIASIPFVASITSSQSGCEIKTELCFETRLSANYRAENQTILHWLSRFLTWGQSKSQTSNTISAIVIQYREVRYKTWIGSKTGLCANYKAETVSTRIKTLTLDLWKHWTPFKVASNTNKHVQQPKTYIFFQDRSTPDLMEISHFKVPRSMYNDK